MQTQLFTQAVHKIVSFLEKEKASYFIIGGLAVGALGEPRFTYDIDLSVLIQKDEIGIFLKRLQSASFKFDAREAILSASEFGSFRFFYKKVQIDVILVSTDLEREAMRRSKKNLFLGKKIFFPTPEDLILFKLIAGRPRDLLDAEAIVTRHKNKLDKTYLKKWARLICKKSQNPGVLDWLEERLRAMDAKKQWR